MTRSILFLITTALTTSVPALAADTHFALQFQRNQIELNQTGREIELDYSSYHIRYGESIPDSMQFDFVVGQSNGHSEDEPLTTGLDMSGFYVGFDFNGLAFRLGPGELLYGLRYIYHDLERVETDLTTNFTWHEFRAQASIKFSLSEAFSLYACGRFVDIQGEELLRGTSNEDLDFQQRSRRAACAGMQIDFGADGYVGVEMESGVMRGANIYFGRYFGDWN